MANVTLHLTQNLRTESSSTAAENSETNILEMFRTVLTASATQSCTASSQLFADSACSSMTFDMPLAVSAFGFCSPDLNAETSLI